MDWNKKQLQRKMENGFKPEPKAVKKTSRKFNIPNPCNEIKILEGDIFTAKYEIKPVRFEEIRKSLEKAFGLPPITLERPMIMDFPMFFNTPSVGVPGCSCPMCTGRPEPKTLDPQDEAELKLFIIAEQMGVKIRPGREFSFNYMEGFIVHNPKAPLFERIMSLAHELGHARVHLSKKIDVSRLRSAKMLGGDGRFVVAEELKAWREGMRILREVGLKPGTKSLRKRFRDVCVQTYRFTHNLAPAAWRNAKAF